MCAISVLSTKLFTVTRYACFANKPGKLSYSAIALSVIDCAAGSFQKTRCTKKLFTKPIDGGSTVMK